MAKSMLCLVQNSKLNENRGKDQLKNRNPVKTLRKMGPPAPPPPA